MDPAWQRRLILGAVVIAAGAASTGCASLIGNHVTVEMQVVDPHPNFIDRALGHRYSNWYSIVGMRSPAFGRRIPVWLIAEHANRRVASDGPDRAMAYLLAHGCEPASTRRCAYRKVLRRIEAHHETERRLVTLHFALAPEALRGCRACVDDRLEIGDRTAP